MKYYVLLLFVLILFNLPFANAQSFNPALPIPTLQQAKALQHHISKLGVGHAPSALIMNLSAYYIFKPEKSITDLLKAKTYLAVLAARKANQTNYGTKLKIDIFRAVITSKMGDSLTAATEFKKIIAIAERKKDYELIAWANYEFGISNYPTKLVASFRKAFNESKKCNNKYLRVTAGYAYAEHLFNIQNLKRSRQVLDSCMSELVYVNNIDHGHYYALSSNIEGRRRNHTVALQTALKGLSWYRNAKDTTYIASSYWAVGRCYRNIVKYPDALHYLRKALHIYERHQDIYRINYLAEEIALVYNAQNDEDRAIATLRFYSTKYPPQVTGVKFRVARTFLELYTDKGDFEMADQYRKEMLSYPSGAKGEYVNKNLADFYFKFNDWKLAKSYYEKVIAIPNISLPAHRRLALIDSANGDFKSALRYFKRYHYLKDSMYNTDARLEEDHLKYDFGLKEKDYQIALKDVELKLRTKNIQTLQQHTKLLANETKLKAAQLQSVQLASQKNRAELALKDQRINFLHKQAVLQENTLALQFLIRNIVIVLVLLCLIVIYLLVRFYRSKQKSERLLASQNTELEQLVKDKSWLLKEMHHRVKNNLHTVMALLQSQSAFLTDDALEAIKASRHRIFAMSLIHQKLYQSDDVKTVDIGVYIPELISYLQDSLNMENHIRFEVDVQSMEFDIYKAVPLGLIINESITNSLKYAFKDRLSGLVKITLVNYGVGRYDLVMEDNGIGLPANYNFNRSNSLGMKLIRGLAKQIDVKLYIESINGTQIMLSNRSIDELKARFSLSSNNSQRIAS